MAKIKLEFGEVRIDYWLIHPSTTTQFIVIMLRVAEKIN